MIALGGPGRPALSRCSRYVFITVLVYGVATATGEMGAYLPVPGCTIATFSRPASSRAASGSPSAGSCGTSSPSRSRAEIDAAVLVLGYWDTPLHDGVVWIAIIVATVVLCSFLPPRVRVRGGRSSGSRRRSRRPLWFSNWDKPAPVKPYILEGDAGRLVCHNNDHYPLGLCRTSGELESPLGLPRDISYRLVLFYILGALAVGVIVPTARRLPPWAIGIWEAGISVLDDVVDGIIALSAWSAANSCMYLPSRSGVPIYAAAIPDIASLLAFMNIGVGAAIVFQWFVSIISTGGFQSWMCCCLSYLRCRSACEYQNVRDLPYRSRFQPYTACGMSVFIPGQWNISSFLTSYIGIPIFIAIYEGHKLTVDRDESWLIPLGDIDLKTGLGEIITNDKSPLPSEK
ncbi:putative proline-specific permease [Biscogniauxia mediterranea]|nr:putative proline-specific permease [Biscogniauxia mediterranea]